MTQYIPPVDIPEGMPWQDVFAYTMEKLREQEAAKEAEASGQLELELDPD